MPETQAERYWREYGQAQNRRLMRICRDANTLPAMMTTFVAALTEADWRERVNALPGMMQGFVDNLTKGGE